MRHSTKKAPSLSYFILGIDYSFEPCVSIGMAYQLITGLIIKYLVSSIIVGKPVSNFRT